MQWPMLLLLLLLLMVVAVVMAGAGRPSTADIDNICMTFAFYT